MRYRKKKTVVGGRLISVVNVCSRSRCEAPAHISGRMLFWPKFCLNAKKNAFFEKKD